MAAPIKAYMFPVQEAAELHAFLMGLPMCDVRIHVQRLEALKPLFEKDESLDKEAD